MKNLKNKKTVDPSKQSNTISDQFKESKTQKDRQEHKKYEGPGFGENFKDKDYDGSNNKQEDDYNSNKLGNGSKVADETIRKNAERKTK